MRRYWVAGLIVVMVALHALIIGYVRTQVARLRTNPTAAVAVGQFRFQPLQDQDHVYCFRMHAVLDPGRRQYGAERLQQLQWEIAESAEQVLRQADLSWLQDPQHELLKSRLLEIVMAHLNEAIVQRVLITDWLRAPSDSIAVNVTPEPEVPTLQVGTLFQ